MATKYEEIEEKPMMANEPLANYSSGNAIAVDYDYVAKITDVMIKLASKLGITLKQLSSKMTQRALYDELYNMCSPQSGLTQRQTVSRLYKKLTI